MELSFQTSQLPYLKQVLWQVHHLEETGETIVPDSCPDIGTIVDSYAGAILRGKDCRDGMISVSGGIKGGILYLAEDGSTPQVLDFYLPFNTKIEHPQLTPQTRVICDVRVRAVDGKIINSRKAMLRVDLSFYVDGYEPESEVIYHLQEKPRWLQVLQRTYPMHLPLAYDEKSFSLHETSELPQAHIIYKVLCRPEVTEQKIIGNKAVFKGNVLYKISYLTENGTLQVLTGQVPFSQFCQMEQEFDEDRLRVIPVITGYDLTTEGEGRGTLTVHVLGQCIISGTKDIPVIEDAYSTEGDLQASWQTYQFRGCLDRQRTPLTIRYTADSEITELQDTEVYPDFPEIHMNEDQVLCKIPASIHAIGRNSDGTLANSNGIGIAEFQNPVCSDAICAGWVSPIATGYGLLAGNSVEYRGEILLDLICSSGQAMKTLSQGVNLPQNEAEPAVILKHLNSDSTLWELAKACHAREDVIKAVNHVEGELLPEGMFLLVPIG